MTFTKNRALALFLVYTFGRMEKHSRMTVRAATFEELNSCTRDAVLLYDVLQRLAREKWAPAPFGGVDYSAHDEGAYFASGAVLPPHTDISAIAREHGIAPFAEQELRKAGILA